MDSASTSSKLISESGWLADLDIRDVVLDSANVEAHSQVMEVSVHQGPVEATSAIIDAGRALTVENLVPAPQCAMLLTSAHAPPLGFTSNTLFLAHITSAAAPFLVPGPSFPPGTREPISVLPDAPILFSGALGAPPAPYSAMQSAGETQGTSLQPMAGAPWPSQATPYASAFMAPPAWPMYMPSLVTCLGPQHSRPCKLSLKSLPGNAKT